MNFGPLLIRRALRSIFDSCSPGGVIYPGSISTQELCRCSETGELQKPRTIHVFRTAKATGLMGSYSPLLLREEVAAPYRETYQLESGRTFLPFNAI